MSTNFGNWAGMKAKLETKAKIYPPLVADALAEELEIEVVEMKKRTPVDTRPNAPHPGQLRDGIHVEEPEIAGSKISCIVATGAEAGDYALYVHENPDAIHPIGQWKYMQSVLDESTQHLANRIAARIHFDQSE
jgi:hypothetical protein